VVGFYDSFLAWTGETEAPPEVARPQALLWEGPGAGEARAEREPPLDTLARQFVADPDGADKALRHVDQVADDDPYLALTQVTALTAIVNHAASREAGLAKRLSDFIQKLKGTLDKIKQAVGAASYTISVGFPISVSVAVTFH
jgi:hypothetical protein